MARPDASKARGIGAARWLALSGRTQHFVLDEGMDLGWRSGSEAQPGIGAWIHCWWQVHVEFRSLGGLRTWTIIFGVGMARSSL